MCLLEAKANSPDWEVDSIIILLLGPVPNERSFLSVPAVASIVLLKSNSASREDDSIQTGNQIQNVRICHSSINGHNSGPSHLNELRIRCHDLMILRPVIGLGQDTNHGSIVHSKRQNQ